ncbi:MAG: DUF58 domain-containing protein [Chloroflexota bacterium]
MTPDVSSLPGARHGQWGWPVALALASIGGGWIAGTLALWRIGALLLVLVIICWLYSRLCLRGLACTRRLPHSSPLSGGLLAEAITLTNRGVWPALWVEITASADLPGYALQRVVTLGPHGRTEWTQTTPCPRRGAYDLDGLIATSGDPFGLFVVRRELGQSSRVIVLPRPVPVRVPDLASSGGPPILEAPLPIRAGERTVLLRLATAADRPAHIAWAPSLRMGTLLARQEEAGSPARMRLVRVLVDLGDVPEQGDGGEEVAGTAAYLINELMRAGHAVGLTCGGEALVHLPAACGPRHASRLWEALALAPGGEEIGLADLIALPRRDEGVVVVTTSPRARETIARGALGARTGDWRPVLVAPPSHGGHAAPRLGGIAGRAR